MLVSVGKGDSFSTSKLAFLEELFASKQLARVARVAIFYVMFAKQRVQKGELRQSDVP